MDAVISVPPKSATNYRYAHVRDTAIICHYNAVMVFSLLTSQGQKHLQLQILDTKKKILSQLIRR